MTRLRSLINVLFLLGPTLAVATMAEAAEPTRPNVLLILADDMGFSDLGCYGGEIATPNLDNLAANGLRFTQFYNTARCWPTRAAALTGYYAQQVRRDTVAGIKSGSQGVRPEWAPLLPEMLRPLGYRSYHSGKWHIDSTPIASGFDRSYSLNDHDRHFYPKQHTEDDKPLPAVDPKEGHYYSTTAIAEHAIKVLKEHAEKYPNRPFFEFLAFTSPHFPVQAPAEDIAKYHKTYLPGWDAMREQRWERIKALNISGASLSAIEREVGPPYARPEAIKKLGPNELNRPLPWSDLTEQQREFQACKMAVHAAMVDRMDQEIGRVLAQLKATGLLDNTVVFFLSDNGASAEIMVRGDGHDPNAECGTGATFLSIGPGWSSLANTPFRRHKTWVHEGGIATPLIVHWPKGFAARGEMRHAQGHVIDLAPTILELAGGKAQAEWKGKPVPKPPGKSLVPALAKDVTVERESLWWMHENNRALRVGDWKIVAAGKESAWELYDLSTDRCETKNLASAQPEKVRELAAMWTKQMEEITALAKADLPGAAVAPQSPFIESYAKDIESLLAEKFAAGKGGMAIALLDEQGSRVFSAGNLDNGNDAQIDGDTIFELGSVTKVFTSLLLLDAVRRGEMNLDDPVAKYVPQGVSVPSRGDKQITLAHLAAQESGLPWHPENLGKKSVGELSLEEQRLAANAYKVEELYEFLSGCGLKQDPGSGFEYSNVGMALLGRAIELRTGRDYESLVVERICRPLKMESTRITLAAPEKARLARGHWLDGSASGHVEFQAMRPAGSLLSTANDLVRFMSANLGFSQSDLTPLMKQTQVIRHTDGPRFGKTAMPWFDEHNYNPPGTELLGHGGGGFGTLAFVAFDKSKRRAVIVLTNQMQVNPYPIGWTIIQGMSLSRENATYGVREIMGVGIALASDQQSGEVRISTVFPKSPAGAAGLTVGLLLRKVDGVSVEGKSLKECVAMLGGSADTKVRLEVLDPAKKEERAVELTREKFLTLMGESPK